MTTVLSSLRPSRRQFFKWIAGVLGSTGAFCGLSRLAAQLGADAGSPSIWTGAVTSNSATVKVWFPGKEPVKLIVNDAAHRVKPLQFEATAGLGDEVGLRTFKLSGLTPATPYRCALQTSNVDAPAIAAQFRTFPQGASSFKFAFSSCASTGSANPVFATIQKHDPLFFLHLGDLHYENITENDAPKFREAWKSVLSSSTQSALYRSLALDYVWDDHDFAGDASDSNSIARPAARLAYREFMPHYPLPAKGKANDVVDGAIFHAFTCGRVRFIITDLRSERTDEKKKDGKDKTMMGAEQKAWFKQELLAAKQGGAALIVWASTVPWIGKPPKGDGWAAFATERKELAEFFKANAINNLCILCGDAHMLAADNGDNSDYAEGGGMRIPVLHGSSLDRKKSMKGGPYSQGTYLPQPGEGCFGWVEVTDTGKTISVNCGIL